jgi:hypothetical protein
LTAAAIALSAALKLVNRYYAVFKTQQTVTTGIQAVFGTLGTDIGKLKARLKDIFVFDKLKTAITAFARSIPKILLSPFFTVGAVAGGVLLNYLFGKSEVIKGKLAEIADQISVFFGGVATSQKVRASELLKGASGLNITGTEKSFGRLVNSKDFSKLSEQEFVNLKKTLDSSYQTLNELEEQRLSNGVLSLQQSKEQ